MCHVNGSNETMNKFDNIDNVVSTNFVEIFKWNSLTLTGGMFILSQYDEPQDLIIVGGNAHQ